MIKTPLAASVAALSLLVVGAATATADPAPYDAVVAGGSVDQATTARAAGVAFDGASLTCGSMQWDGTALAGPTTGLLFSFSSLSASSCTWALGMPMNLTPVSAGEFVAHDPQAPGVPSLGQTDVVTGRVQGIEFVASTVSNPTFCTFTVQGSVPAYFDESTQEIQVVATPASPGLLVTSATGCLGTPGIGPIGMAADFEVGVTGNPSVALPVNVTP